MLFRKIPLVFFVMIGLVGLSRLAAAACMTGAEDDAEKVRYLQAQLMVAALQCHHIDADAMRANYARFLSSYRSTLNRSTSDLQAYHHRTYGTKYRTEFDRHLTRLANLASLQSQRDRRYCRKVMALGEVLAENDDLDLAQMTSWSPLASPLQRNRCPATATKSLTSTR